MTKKNILAFCGFRCDLCPACENNAGKGLDKAKINAGWQKYFGFTVAEDKMVCAGCRESACTLDPGCLIRPCALKNGVDTCADCLDFHICEKLAARADITDELRKKYNNELPAEDEKLFFTPYEGRKNLHEIRKDKRTTVAVELQERSMKALWWTLGGAAVLAAGLVIFLGYLGIFSRVAVSEKAMGPYVFAYEEFTGPYAQTQPVFDRVNEALTGAGITSTMGIGIYYDNPSQVPSDKLRSKCGSLIEEKDLQKAGALSDKIKTGSIERADCVAAEFPIKNALSFIVGPMKVYPVIARYLAEKGYKTREAYEIYDMANMNTYYLMPVEK